MRFITKKIFLYGCLACFFPFFVSANVQGYAWSESVGYFDFANTIVSDTDFTGYAYNDNTGWLVLSSVTNSNGVFSGYAWSESVGYFDFSNVSISNGDITGYAYNDNTGWLNFTDGAVSTTWMPEDESREIRSSGSVARKTASKPVEQDNQTREQLEMKLRTLLLQLLILLQAQLEILQNNQ